MMIRRIFRPTQLNGVEFTGRVNSHCILSVLILFLAGWTLFWQLGQGSFNDWDEATYAEIAREMVMSGDWITPHWNGLPLHDKPPLVMWLMAGGMMFIKPIELAARLPPALAGLFTVGMTALLGRSLFCTWTGLTAAALLLVSGSSDVWDVNFVLLARQGMLDVPLTGFMLWTLLHFWLGIRRPEHWLLMGVPLGLAVLTKSFLAITIVLVILVFVTVLGFAGQSLSRQHWRYAAGGVFVAFVISLPWHLVQLLMHGHDFLDGYVLIHSMKMVRPESGNTGDWAFYLMEIREALPYFVWISLPAVCLMVWRGIRYRDHGAVLLVIWLAIPLLLFSLIPTKLPWYVVPILPALTLAIAVLFRAAVPHHWIPETLFLGAVVLVIALWNVKVLKPVDFSQDVKTLGDRVVGITPVREQIAYYHPKEEGDELRPLFNIRPSIRVYTNRPMIRIHDPEQLDEWVKQGGRFVWVEESLADEIPVSFMLIAQVEKQKYFRHRGSSLGEVVDGQPMVVSSQKKLRPRLSD
jgi:4-amino-4-deoxy-L-arabinose transferase-like glycosyltransferase